MVAFYLPGGIPVYTFSVFLAFGVFLGLAWIILRSGQKQALHRVEAGMWVLLAGLIGGRLVHVAVSWLYYQDHFLESLQFYRGGLSWPGALAGGLLGLAAFAAFNRIPLAGLADDLLPLLAALSVSAWLGCWLTGCAYGVASEAWWSLPSPDEWGVVANRWPIQIWAALLTVGLFALIEWWAGAARFEPGYRTLLGLLGLSLILLATAVLRTDPALTWNGLRLEAWAALGFCLLAFIGLVSYSRYQAQAKTKLVKENPV